MVDIKSTISALKISWLKLFLSNEGKITKLLFVLCPLACDIAERGGEFANVLMQRVHNPFWFDMLSFTKG